jgi:hypothetical protein
MAYTEIDRSDLYFNTKLYTGNGSTQSINGIGFQPDWVWIKERNNVADHKLYDAVRGATKVLESSNTGAEGTDVNGLTAFDSDGFSLGSSGSNNGSGDTYASWNWKAGGTASSNTDGSITSTVSANTTSGFSIVSYTGTGANATVGHGLGVAPAMIITKDRDSGGSGYWGVYHQSLGNTKALFLNVTNAAGTNIAYWNNTSPTTSVFSLGDGSTSNVSSENHIAYCFAEKKGFSKFGSYTGNGSTGDGTFVYTGFKPAWLMIKRTDTGDNWPIEDNKRNPSNLNRNFLLADTNGAEGTVDLRDFLSNGFKIRGSAQNNSGGTFIYMAFASEPFTTSTGIPCTAR